MTDRQNLSIPEEIAALNRSISESEERLKRDRIRLALLQEDGMEVAGIRDPANPCTAYEPGTPSGQCETDGHYLCDGCRERDTCDFGCGKRKSFCECRYCEVCESWGTGCECPPDEWTKIRYPIRPGTRPSNALFAYSAAIGRGLVISPKIRYALRAMSEIEKEREEAKLRAFYGV